ncbi:hypothetical protein EGW08_021415 [Elysia chlorotica]|uniref:RanBP2-type domain-containing protein n=1 Tax=Elysia chlorotica TaxID=188477 RepID=A0A3S0Z714_ELYCH|nr:hypothetical protein EGW08_021415 [Elysia chlorotica]
MADDDFSALSSLKHQYPSVPSTVVLKFINKYGNDREKCKLALDLERKNYPPEEGESSANSTSANNSNCSSAENVEEANTISSRLRELQVKHTSQPASPSERHISTIQRAVGGNVSQAADTKKPRVGQSVSWTVQATERQTSSSSGASSQYVPAFPSTTPQTAPADFTPFMFASNMNEIPQIDCNIHAGRPSQNSSSSSSSSPGEQRRPVKVINIPPGSLSGGSVSPAATLPNSRHQIRMHFGDTGGVCTVSGPPSNFHNNQTFQNANPHYRTELYTEAAVLQPIHSSSIFVNTSNPNLPPVQAKPITSGHVAEGRRAINPPLSLNTSTCDNQKTSGHNGMFPSNELLSFPVQASSPGTVNSKPMFVEIKRDNFQMQEDMNNSNQHSYFTSTIGQSIPQSAGFASHPMLSYNPVGAHSYLNHYNQDFSNPSGYTGSQCVDQFTPQQQFNYSGHPINPYQPTMSSVGNQNPYPPFNTMYSYPGSPMGVVGQGVQYGYNAHVQAGQSTSLSRVSMLSSSRSNSQESEHSTGADFDPRIAFSTSRVSSHSSPSSDKSCPSLERADSRPRTNSVQDQVDELDGYVRALLQHQKNRCQKMSEENVKYRDILINLRKEVSEMEKSKTGSSRINSFPSADDIARLCENNRSLQTDIQMYMNELEMYKQGQVPINEMNPHAQQNFFENMPTGQQDPIYSRTPGSHRAVVPPPRPPPPIPARQRSTEPPASSSSGGRHFNNNSDIYRVPPVPPPQPTVNSGESEEGEHWNCKACTFSNFPALKECEMCGLLRDPPSSGSSSIFSSPVTFASGGPPALPPHHPLTTLPPRLAQSLLGNQRHRSNSPSPADVSSRHHQTGS